MTMETRIEKQNNFAVAFGKNLRKFRMGRHLTQQEIAIKIMVSTSTYANWEQGRREISSYHLKLLTEVLNVDMNRLFDFN